MDLKAKSAETFAIHFKIQLVTVMDLQIFNDKEQEDQLVEICTVLTTINILTSKLGGEGMGLKPHPIISLIAVKLLKTAAGQKHLKQSISGNLECAVPMYK
jgi:hypothetical protein